MKVIPPRIIKAFAIASSIGAVIRADDNPEYKLKILMQRVNAAMKVFSVQVGREEYKKISNKIAIIFEEIEAKYKGKLDEEDIPQFVELLATLVPPKDYQEFLVLKPYTTNKPRMLSKRLLNTLAYFDIRLAELFATKAATYPIQRPKQKQVKQKKPRDKKKPKVLVQKVSSAKIKKSLERKRKQRLKEMIRKAKEKMSWIKDLDKTTVICFVDSFAESAIKHIVGYDETMSHPFIDEDDQHWKRAEPVKSEDCYDSRRT